jgi:hypothetical protein
MLIFGNLPSFLFLWRNLFPYCIKLSFSEFKIWRGFMQNSCSSSRHSGFQSWTSHINGQTSWSIRLLWKPKVECCFWRNRYWALSWASWKQSVASRHIYLIHIYFPVIPPSAFGSRKKVLFINRLSDMYRGSSIWKTLLCTILICLFHLGYH